MCRKVLLLFFVLVFLGGCSKSAYHTNVGYWKMYTKDIFGAEKNLVEALLENPGNLFARYNLAVNDISTEQLKNALTELDALEEIYERSESKKFSKELFEVYFAKGFVRGMVQDVDGALESYQKALSIDPKSKDVKRNIELLTTHQTKDGKGKGRPQNNKGKKGEGEEGEKGQKSDKKEGEDENPQDQDIQGQDQESLKRKNLSKEEIEQILKEIKQQESKVRAKESRKNGDSGKGDDDKSW